jgi:S1-C subfamily serine protease
VPVQPGNSGGPLLDGNGNLIGVVESKLGLKAAQATNDLPQNVAYAVKSAYVLALLEPYLENGAPGPRSSKAEIKFEEMVATAERSVVVVLAY